MVINVKNEKFYAWRASDGESESYTIHGTDVVLELPVVWWCDVTDDWNEWLAMHR